MGQSDDGDQEWADEAAMTELAAALDELLEQQPCMQELPEEHLRLQRPALPGHAPVNIDIALPEQEGVSLPAGAVADDSQQAHDDDGAELEAGQRHRHQDTFHWGPFLLTYLPEKGARPAGWQASCPFHKKTTSTACKKAYRLSPAQPHQTLDDLKTRLIYWCSKALSFDRQRWHVLENTRHEVLPNNNLFDNADRQAQLTAALRELGAIKTDEELDGMHEARAGAAAVLGPKGWNRKTTSIPVPWKIECSLRSILRRPKQYILERLGSCQEKVLATRTKA